MNKSIILSLTFIFIMLIGINFVSAITETASQPGTITSTPSQSTHKGMVINLTNSNGYLISVGKSPSSEAVNVSVSYDAPAALKLAVSNPFVGNTATFGNNAPLLNTSTFFFLTAQNSTMIHALGSTVGLTYPTPSSNSYIKFIGWDNDGAFQATDAWADFISATVLIPPGVSLDSPNDVTSSTAPSIAFNATGYTNTTDTMKNLTLIIWYSNSSIFNKTTNPLVGLNPNQTSFNFSFSGAQPGLYYWGGYMCNALDRCVYSDTNYSIIYGVTKNNEIFNASTYETAYEGIGLNVSVSNGISVSSARLYYNGTRYTSPTITNIGNNHHLLTQQVTVPLVPGNKTFFWELSLSNGQNLNLSNNGQLVSAINLTICGAAPQNIPYLNITFKNETIAQQTVSGAMSASFAYWLGDQSVNKTYTFLNVSDNPSYAFCLTPSNRTINVIPNIQYYNSYSPQRNYAPGTLSYTNTTTNKILYLLPSSLGSYVTFVVINTAGQSIIGATVNITSPTSGLIESVTTDAAGSATFFLDPTVSYTITAFKVGYPISINTIVPTQTTYTISLGTTAVSSNIIDSSRQVSYSIGPALSYLLNQTTYQFNLSINSTYWNIDSFGFTLTNSTGDILGSNSSSIGNLGTVSLNWNTGNDSQINMNYFWVINSSYFNFTKSWFIYDYTASEHSINAWTLRLRSYLIGANGGTGIFGLTSFGLNLIVFILVFGITGIVSYKFGLTSPAAVLAVLTALVILVDVGLGLITYPTQILQNIHGAVVVCIIALLVFFSREVVG